MTDPHSPILLQHIHYQPMGLVAVAVDFFGGHTREDGRT